MLLDKGKDSIEQGISEVETAIQQLENNSTVLNFKNIAQPYDKSNVIKIMNLMKTLSNYGFCNDVISDYYIIYNENNTVVNPNWAAALNDFYIKSFSYKDIPYETWHSEWFDNHDDSYFTFVPARNAIDDGKECSVITVVRPVKYLLKYKGIRIIFLLNNSEFQKRLGSIDNSGESIVYIVDKDNHLITSSPGLSKSDKSYKTIMESTALLKGFSGNRIFKLNGEEMLLTYTSSDDYGWKYVSLQPYKSVLQKASALKKTIILLMAVSLIVGLLIITILVYTNGRPVKKLLSMAVDSGQMQNVSRLGIYRVLQNTFSRLEYDNVRLSKKLEEQKPFLTATFFERLLRGGFKTVGDIEAIISHVGIDIGAKFYTVAIICLNGYNDNISDNTLEELSLKRVLLKELLQSTGKDGRMVFFHDLDENKVAMLVTGNMHSVETEREEVKVVICWAVETLKNIEGLNASMYVGITCDSLIKVPVSMNSAQQCMNYGQSRLPDEKVIWQEDISEVFNGY